MSGEALDARLETLTGVLHRIEGLVAHQAEALAMFEDSLSPLLNNPANEGSVDIAPRHHESELVGALLGVEAGLYSNLGKMDQLLLRLAIGGDNVRQEVI